MEQFITVIPKIVKRTCITSLYRILSQTNCGHDRRLEPAVGITIFYPIAHLKSTIQTKQLTYLQRYINMRYIHAQYQIEYRYIFNKYAICVLTVAMNHCMKPPINNVPVYIFFCFNVAITCQPMYRRHSCHVT